MPLSKVPNEYLPIPTSTLPGAVYPDGSTITQDATGKISANVPLGSDTPAAEAVAATGSTGVSALTAREDHVHAMPGAFGASGTNHAPGFVPDPGATAGTTRYLREDGSFAVPPTSSGAQGNPGAAATISVGTTTTGAAGSSASVTNSGSSSAAVLNFTIPAPVNGTNGTNGTNGASGVSPTISSITASALSAGSNPTASVTAGSNNSYSIALGIPAGAAGSSASVTATAPIVITNGVVSISAATESAAGSMSAADKTKLDGIAVNATAFTPAAVAAPSSVTAAQISYNSASAELVQFRAVYSATPASGAASSFGWETSTDGSTWSAETLTTDGVFTAPAFTSGSMYARCRAYALTTSGTAPTPSAWVASAAVAYAGQASTSASLTVQGNSGQNALNFAAGSVVATGSNSVYTPPTVTPNGYWTPTVKPGYGALVNTTQSITSGLIAVFPFNEGSGSTIHDVTAYGNSLALSGSPLWTPASDGSTFLRFNATAAGALNQSANQTTIAQNELPGLANAAGMTWIGRIYLYSGGYNNNYAHFFQLSPSGQANNEILYLRPDQNNTGQVSFFDSGNLTAKIIVGPQWSTLVAGWHQVAVSYNNSTGAAVLYIDGIASVSGTFNAGDLTTSSANVTTSLQMFGGNTSGYYLAADVDFVAIWNRVLTAAEVASVYSAPYQLWTPGPKVVRSVSASYTITDTGEVLIQVNAASSAVAVTLPSYVGRLLPITIIKTDSSSNAVTAVYSGSTIATLTTQNQSRRIESTGSAYLVTAGYL